MGPFGNKLPTITPVKSLNHEKNCLCHPNVNMNYTKAKSFVPPLKQYYAKTMIDLNQASNYPSNFKSNSNSLLTSSLPPKLTPNRQTKSASPDEPKQSFSSLTSRKTTSCLDTGLNNTNGAFKVWLNKKTYERRQKEEARLEAAKQQQQEREAYLASERDSFARWLTNKKGEEERRRVENEKRQKATWEKRQHRYQQCELQYQLWLKKKEQAEIQQKITEQLNLLKAAEINTNRSLQNQKAYQEWLNKSKSKHKPITPNQGVTNKRCRSLTRTLPQLVPIAESHCKQQASECK